MTLASIQRLELDSRQRPVLVVQHQPDTASSWPVPLHILRVTRILTANANSHMLVIALRSPGRSAAYESYVIQ